ncbi:PREDICTED: uncharacterized protein LOC108562896 [Nicrophorus vespilloides]|uniref:Uncharacterized protein LOC108562896 n=1 Tax=Nicrophorus vespilloides TaxID=110193 RepID=A0ABM1MQN3_NICVS|nr:PREDICTED: uncharacterized protein LOC108562896 [Nicrophorus vespilloides]
MGYFAPTFLAFILNSCGIYIFHESTKPGCEPLVSCLIFLVAVFLLLWDMRLFPSSLRKLWRCGAYFFQFIISAFLMEHIMNDFWFPLEASMFAFFPKIAQFEDDILKQSGWTSSGVLQILKCDLANVVASYALSLFFFFGVLHATRVIDFRLLKCGYSVFLDDVRYRSKKLLKRVKRLALRRHVKFEKGHCRERDPFSVKNYEAFEEPDYTECCVNRKRRPRY